MDCVQGSKQDRRGPPAAKSQYPGVLSLQVGGQFNQADLPLYNVLKQTGAELRRRPGAKNTDGLLPIEYSAGYTLADVRMVIGYLQREIRATRRNVGALKSSNLLQPDRFEEDVQISPVALRPPLASAFALLPSS